MTNSMAIANIARIDILIEQNTPTVYTLTTASEASIETNVSTGSDTELRVKNQILAQNVTEDIVKGYNINLKDVELAPDVFALVDGGTSYPKSNGDLSLYTSPVAGEVITRNKFWMYVYTEQKDYDGGTLGYTAWIFPHCVGSPASVSFRDGEFFAPSYTIKSKPSKGGMPLKIVNLPSLPKVISSYNDMPGATYQVNNASKTNKPPVANNTTILIAGNPYTNNALVNVTVGENQTEDNAISNELKTVFVTPNIPAKGTNESETDYNARVSVELAKVAKGEIAVCKTVTSNTANNTTTYSYTYKILSA